MHRILVVGTGGIGQRHTRCFQKTGRADVGICEIREDLREEVAEQYEISKKFSSLDDALEENWDGALIATPAHTHVPVAMKISEARLAMLIEKPLSTSDDGLAELVERIDSIGSHVAVAYTWREHPGLKAMKEAIDSNQFGRPVEVILVSGHNYPTYRPDYRDIYFADHGTGGGAIQDQLTHWVNAAEWMVGPVTRLSADAGHCVLKGVAVEDTVHMLTRHADVMGSYSLNLHQAAYETSLTVVCESGVFRFEADRHLFRWKDKPDSASRQQPWHDGPVQIHERDDLFIRQAESFCDMLEGKAEPACTLQDGIQTLRVNLAALASAADDGKWETILVPRPPPAESRWV